MMGGETFNRLKAGLLGTKSVKQAEPRVVVLRLILSIAGLSQPKTAAKHEQMRLWVVLAPISARYG